MDKHKGTVKLTIVLMYVNTQKKVLGIEWWKSGLKKNLSVQGNPLSIVFEEWNCPSVPHGWKSASWRFGAQDQNNIHLVVNKKGSRCTHRGHAFQTNKAYEGEITPRTPCSRIYDYIHWLFPFHLWGFHGKQSINICRPETLLQGIKGQPLLQQELVVRQLKQKKRCHKINTSYIPPIPIE